MPLAERRLIGGVIGETPTELSSAPGRPRRLPDDLLRQASQRLEIMALVSLALFVFLRRGTRDPSTVMDLALVYMVAMAFAIARRSWTTAVVARSAG